MANTFSINTYNPRDVQLIIAGYQIVGWERITIARNSKGFNTVKGIRNKHTRTETRDTSGVLTFSVLQTSASNEVLSYIHELDLDEKTARLSIILKDSSGKSVFSSDEAFITGYPTTTYSGNFEYRSWEIAMHSTKTFLVAGNTRPATNFFDSVLSEASDFVSDLF